MTPRKYPHSNPNLPARLCLPWTSDEVHRLIDIRRTRSLSYAEMAKMLDRSTKGVASKLRSLGISRIGIIGAPRKHSSELVARIMQLYDPSRPDYISIAAEVGVTRAQVGDLIHRVRHNRRLLT